MPLQTLKLACAGVVLVILALSYGWVYNHGKSVQRAEQQEEYVQALLAKEAEIQRQASINRQVSNDYQTKLTDLDARYRSALDRPPVVRLRACPGDSLPATPAGPSGTPPATPGNELPGPSAPDIGPDLVLMAKDADMCVQKLQALQEWARKP